jgi:topoisomerase IA-like protein
MKPKQVPIDQARFIPYSLPSTFKHRQTTIPMGQQSNKVQKRRRRLAYLERKKAKAKAAAISKPAAKKKPAPKKAATAEAAAE